ncbi:hypothetical protein CAS74_001792 [Pichia kudriavzevii]|uniref:HBS1-like protein N-terminal domain-containing protein n=1 Tax=Pichia kudriavzevii TaxID=4909 RepID=A0A1Z8JSS3_PICKU|nr:hypothetical protein CAS74_001792 [Pichia kudriavzevii]
MDEYDGYSDHSYEGFDEDALDDEEYELLYAQLPSFRNKVKSKNYHIDEDLLKEYLWEAEFDPDVAFEIVTENHKRIVQQPPFPTSKLNKCSSPSLT